MKKQILFALLLLVCSIAKAQTSPFPDPNIHIYDGNSMSVYAYVSIDGVVIGPDQVVEVAAFCGNDYDNCRGKLQTTKIASHENPILNGLLLYGNPGDVFNFKLYNITTGTLYEGVCLEEVSYVPQGFFGYATDLETMHFVTPATCTFTNVDGNNWSTEANWEPRIPASCDDAVINGACIATEEDLVFKSLTIKDGAQFLAPTDAVISATVEKYIQKYSGTKDNYYFVSNPTDAEFLETENLLEGNFDLYFFDECGLDDPDGDDPITKEWQNFKDPYYSNPEDFSAAYNAYLYANDANTTLKFSGLIETSESVSYKKIPMMGGENFNGFNLIGNPYTCNVSVSKGTNISGFYVLNNHTEVIPLNNPIVAPCSAIFAVSTRYNNINASVTFTPNINGTGARNIENLINIEVSNDYNLLDRAYVRFNEQDNLQKFTLNPEATHIYFREEGKDYAIVQGNERMSQLPLFFKTREYGTYTINVKLENLTCEYLHLIDNLTGMDIDLLATPSYTFRATSSDYACRFKLVFEGTGVEENNAAENFAIVEGNRVIIPMIEHESTLEIIDMTGRTISSQKVNGSFDHTLNVKAGIYMLRLNGMTQKIVIE